MWPPTGGRDAKCLLRDKASAPWDSESEPPFQALQGGLGRICPVRRLGEDGFKDPLHPGKEYGAVEA